MPTPPRAPVALAVIAAVTAGVLPTPPLPVAPARALITAPYVAVGSAPVAPGVTHEWGSLTTSRGNQNVQVVTVEPFRPEISFEAALSNDRASGLERVTSMAARRSAEAHRVVASINGDVWAGTANLMENAPSGLHVDGGELMTAGPSARPTFTVDASRTPRIGSVGVALSMTVDGVGVPIARLNQERRAGELALYTARFGERLSAAASGTEVVIGGLALPLRPSGAWSGIVAEVRPAGGGAPIDPGTVVLTGPAGSLALGPLVPGVPVTITTAVTPGFEAMLQAAGGREYLVRGGAPFVFPRPTSAGQTHPRSAIGITADERVVMATVDGRHPDESLGVTLDELADLMISRGAVEAINLDGGGSTTLAVRRPGDSNVTVVNAPSDGRERSVTNSIQVVSTAPTGPLSVLSVRPGTSTVYERATVAYRTVGTDAAYNAVPVDPGTVTWSVDGTAGTIDQEGRFRADTAGVASILAQAGGVVGQATVTVVPDTMPPVVRAPTTGLPSGSAIGPTGVPVTVRWDPAVDAGSGVVAYELQRSVDGGAWTQVALRSPASRSITLVLPRNKTARLAVRATDAAGNVGSWAVGGSFRVAVAPETTRALTFVRGTWSRTRSASYDGGVARSTRTPGGISRFTFTGTAVAWVSARSPVRGSAEVYVDRLRTTTVDLHRPSPVARQMVFSRSWAASGLHTVEIRTAGTAGHPRVDIDALVVLTPATEPAGSAPAGGSVPPGLTPPGSTPPGSIPPVSTTDPVLVGAGDIASCGLTGDARTATVVRSIAGTVFTAGDNAYEFGTAREYADCYAPTWGVLKSRTRPSPGNHDYGTSGAAGYFAYFGARAGTAGEGWYAYDLGAWRVYALNSNCSAIGGCGAGSAQERWLRADLAANPRRCVAAYWHHPLFSSGAHGNSASMRPIWEALHAAGADVVVNGHDHDYERFAPQDPEGFGDPERGIREFVVGTGGASLRDFATIRPNSEVRDSSTLGVLKLTLRTDSYAWQFVPVADGAFTDAGQDTCR